jgi:hypothetical protein
MSPQVLDEPLPMWRQSRKVADAYRQTSRRPGIDQRDDRDRRRPLVPMGRRLRDHSHANSGANHSANGVKPRKPNPEFQAAASASRVVLHRILEGVARREANLVISKSIAKPDGALMAHRMITWRDQHESVFREWKSLKFFGRIDFVANDANVGEVSGDSAYDVAAGTLLEIDIDLRILRQERGQGSGKKLSRCRRICKHAHAPPEPLGVLRQFSTHPFQLLSDQLRMMYEGGARRRRANTTPMPFEERGSEIYFHQPNAFARRCQRHTRPRRTMGNARCLGDKQEQPQINQIKAHGSFHDASAFGIT